jgi:hypothetical protein
MSTPNNLQFWDPTMARSLKCFGTLTTTVTQTRQLVSTFTTGC